MKYILSLLMISCLHTNGQTAKEVLEKSSYRIKNLKDVAYNIYYENAEEKVTADVVIKRGADLPIFEVGKIKVSGLAISNEGSKQITFAYNGSSFDFIDQDTHQTVKLDSPNYRKLGRTRMMGYTLLALPVYWQKEPFGNFKDITTEKMEDTVVYNEPCYKLKLKKEINSEVSGKQISEAIWFIGKKDQLIYGNRSATYQQYLRIKSIDQDIDDSVFVLAKDQQIKKITGLEPLGNGLLAVGQKAPLWSLPTSKQKILSLSSLKGKVVLLDFWGTWCVPCIKAMPDIQAISTYFKAKPVAVIGVSVETEKSADPVGFMKRKGYTYPLVLNGDKIAKEYKVQEFPTIYLIDKNGTIIHAEHGGNRDNFKEDIIAKIEHALLD